MLFFVLSGFVIHLPNTYGGPFLIPIYFARRFARIYPPYVIALALSVVVWLLLPEVTDYHGGWVIVEKALLMVQNYPHFGYDLPRLQPARNFALWSLPVELELYIVYPILLIGARRWGFNRMVLAVVATSAVSTAFELGLRTTNDSSSALAAWLPTFAHYLVIWCAGAWLAQRMVDDQLPKWDIKWTILFIASAACSLLGRDKLHVPIPIDDFFWALTFFCLILWILSLPARREAFTRRVFAPFRQLGKISYSLYLIHLPVFFVISGTVFSASGYRTTNFAYCVGSTLIAIAVAAIFYFCVEAPSTRFARRFARSS